MFWEFFVKNDEKCWSLKNILIKIVKINFSKNILIQFFEGNFY